MAKSSRSLLILNRHRRLQRLWQFIFTGWGLVFFTLLAASPFFVKNMLWTPLSLDNLPSIVQNQFQMTDAEFSGLDQNKNPVHIRARSATKNYDSDSVINFVGLTARIVRVAGNQKITDNIRANGGTMNTATKKVYLVGDVRIDSSNGDKIRTNSMEIQL
ncbi:MAG: hypothetical protein LBO08_00680 [Rickettsiales bacterium]|jgi:hypothetical protein|nr:hypothetical protein [Rickettsiales bacterium]